MSGFDYIKSAGTADRLIARFGKPTSIYRVTTGAYNPATGSATVTQTEQVANVVVLDFPQAFIDGTLIKQGDRKAYVTPFASAIQQGDTFAWEGQTMTVVSAKKLAPAGSVVLYELQVRSQ
jgi:hypothetical protein